MDRNDVGVLEPGEDPRFISSARKTFAKAPRPSSTTSRKPPSSSPVRGQLGRVPAPFFPLLPVLPAVEESAGSSPTSALLCPPARGLEAGPAGRRDIGANA